MMKSLSDDQARGVRFGMTPPESPSWGWVNLAAGPQPIPTWARAMHINWHDGVSNTPSYTLRARGELRSWPDQRFERIGDTWISRHEDGRAIAFYQEGPLRMESVRRFRTISGELKEYRDADQDGEWVRVERPCTRKDEGFGGANIDITMLDGTEVTLRGPWSGGTPPGYVSVGYVNASDPQRWWRKSAPWHQHVATGPLYVTEDLFQRLFARFCAHLRLARVNEGWGWSLQALREDWDAPKEWIYRAEIERKRSETSQAEVDRRFAECRAAIDEESGF